MCRIVQCIVQRIVHPRIVHGSPPVSRLQVPDRLVVHALLGRIMPGVVPPLARGVQLRFRSHAVEVVPTGRRAPQRRAARGRMSMSQRRLRSWWVLRLRGDRACRWRPLHVALGLHGARFSAHSAPTCPTHVRIPSCGAVHAVPAARSGYSDLSGTDGATDPRLVRHTRRRLRASKGTRDGDPLFRVSVVMCRI